ncbi:hypothetical protein LCGC14_0439980 [marine sediment metagenome]|uniref:3-isopropylmalate dehydratase n=1 Tax=marine sediment metagenome TaxID=412755 RepID=A0A0F9VUZ4_9ZZZZ
MPLLEASVIGVTILVPECVFKKGEPNPPIAEEILGVIISLIAKYLAASAADPQSVFDEMRRDENGKSKDFVLNKPAYRNAEILVAGDNFGCGSSREHAPWALLDFGIRCVISTSFADIFYNNCFKNGILPIRVTPEQLDLLMDDAERGANARLTIDLETQTIAGPDGGEISFEIDPFRKHCLLNGLDDIGLTMEKAGSIASYETALAERRPWA